MQPVLHNDISEFINKFKGRIRRYKFYDGQVTIEYDYDKHIYSLVTPTGLEQLISSSSVGKIIDKSDALVPWACKMMEQKLLATVPMLMEMPDGQQGFLSTEEGFKKLVAAAKTAHKDKLEDAGKVGSVVHDWIERYIKAQISNVSFSLDVPEEERARNGVCAALNWMNQHKVRWISTERKVYSRQYKYAGTLDGLCYVSSCSDPRCCPVAFTNRLTVADWKTSNYLYIEYILQVTSYLVAYNEETNANAVDRWIIRLGKDDGEFDPWHLGPETLQDDMAAFLLALDLTRAVNLLEARMAEYKTARSKRKAALKAATKAEALKAACKASRTYTGTRKPRCKAFYGEPCEACLKKYNEKHQQEGI